MRRPFRHQFLLSPQQACSPVLHGLSTGAIFMRHLAIFGDVFDDHNLGDGGLLLASSVISRDQR